MIVYTVEQFHPVSQEYHSGVILYFDHYMA